MTAETAELVQKVKELCSSDPALKQQWLTYTDQKGGRTRDPARHEAEFLQEFIGMAEGMAGGMAGGSVAATMETLAPIDESTDLVAYIKELQRGNPTAKEQWMLFAEAQGGGVLDPSRHTSESLQTFLGHLNAGGSFEESGANMGEFIKSLQRRSTSFKLAWVTFCKTAAGGKNDPMAHDSGFHAKFFEQLSQAYVKLQSAGGLPGASPMPMVAAAPAARMMTPRVAAPAASAGGKDSLVQAVKDFQKSSPENKELWKQYADAFLGGKLDPNRHEAAVLLEFCVNHGVSGVAAGGMGGMAAMPAAAVGGMIGAGGGEKAALVDAVKNFQKSSPENKELWKQYADAYLGGKLDPNRHEAAVLLEFCVNHGADVPAAAAMAEPPAKKMRTMAPAAAMGGGGDKAAVVEAVKNFQKSSPENKELWKQYADAFLGGKLDPNRHEAAVLQEFCVNHGVPGVAAGAVGGMAVIQPAAAAAGFGGAAMARAGGMAMAGAGGGDKLALVERIKVFQKADRATNGALWLEFCGATKDPNRHEAAKLLEFCTMNGC